MLVIHDSNPCGNTACVLSMYNQGRSCPVSSSHRRFYVIFAHSPQHLLGNTACLLRLQKAEDAFPGSSQCTWPPASSKKLLPLAQA